MDIYHLDPQYCRLLELCIHVQLAKFVKSVGYVKAFDKVRHEPLIDMLLALDIDGQEVELIKNLYWDQQAAVRYNGEISK